MSGEKFARKIEQQSEIRAADESIRSAMKEISDINEANHAVKAINDKRGTASKLLTFALLLAVPAVMTGCNSTSNCNPEYENCSTGSGGSTGGAYYGGGSAKSPGSSDSSSSSSSSGVYKGLGSGGTKSSGG